MLHNMFDDTLRQGITSINKKYKEQFKRKRSKILPDNLHTYPISPSRLSIKIQKDDGFVYFYGKCARELVFRTLNVRKTNPPTIDNQLKMMMGNYIEQMYQDIIANADEIIVYNNVSFFRNKDMFDLPVFGEIDLLFIVDGKPIPIEIKSFSGYRAERMYKGTRYFKPQPKPEHFIQAVTYLYVLKNYRDYTFFNTEGDVIDIQSNITQDPESGLIKYMERAYGAQYNFILHINEEPSLDPKSLAADSPLLKFNNYSFSIENDSYEMPIVMYPFTMYDLLKRARNVSTAGQAAKDFMDGKSTNIILPRRDPQYQYSNTRLEFMCNNKNGLDNMNKRDMMSFHSWKGSSQMPGTYAVKKGDWQCMYCDYAEFCLGVNRDQGELRTDEAIIFDLKQQKEKGDEDEIVKLDSPF